MSSLSSTGAPGIELLESERTSKRAAMAKDPVRIAHLRDKSRTRRGICGKPISGIPASPDAERCVVCLELAKQR